MSEASEPPSRREIFQCGRDVATGLDRPCNNLPFVMVHLALVYTHILLNASPPNTSTRNVVPTGQCWKAESFGSCLWLEGCVLWMDLCHWRKGFAGVSSCSPLCGPVRMQLCSLSSAMTGEDPHQMPSSQFQTSQSLKTMNSKFLFFICKSQVICYSNTNQSNGNLFSSAKAFAMNGLVKLPYDLFYKHAAYMTVSHHNTEF